MLKKKRRECREIAIKLAGPKYWAKSNPQNIVHLNFSPEGDVDRY